MWNIAKISNEKPLRSITDAFVSQVNREEEELFEFIDDLQEERELREEAIRRRDKDPYMF